MSRMRIRGSKPRTFPVGAAQYFGSLVTVYGRDYVGRDVIVPDGLVLVIPEHGDWYSRTPEIRHEFPAGTRFRVVAAGGPRNLAVTDVFG